MHANKKLLLKRLFDFINDDDEDDEDVQRDDFGLDYFPLIKEEPQSKRKKRKKMSLDGDDDEDDDWAPIFYDEPVKKRKYTKKEQPHPNQPLTSEQQQLFDKYEFPRPLDTLKCPPFETKVKSVNIDVDMSKAFACHVCASRFSTNQNLRSHLVKFHSEHYNCCYCKRAFGLEEEEELKLHMFKHEHKLLSGSPMTCIQCGMYYPKMFRYVEHLKRKGPFHNDQCSQCEQKLTSYEEYKDHVTAEHNGRWVHKCGFCETKYDDIASLKRLNFAI